MFRAPGGYTGSHDACSATSDRPASEPTFRSLARPRPPLRTKFPEWRTRLELSPSHIRGNAIRTRAIRNRPVAIATARSAAIFEDTKDLVVALPTSAGKTRIAELCILACLAQGRRAVYVTRSGPSAQTERVLERTFAPLGADVSSLYGSMGVSDVDEDALRTSQIVVATPEKLDFALRSDPRVLDDVGLVVLDEGHMIGPSDREVRYEAQVQRLLCEPTRRPGALCAFRHLPLQAMSSTTSSDGLPAMSPTACTTKTGGLPNSGSGLSNGEATTPA